MLLSSLVALCALSAAPAPQGTFIFPPNDKHNHGSAVAECPNGDLLAIWYHGTGERTTDDVVLLGARLRKGETAWSEPFPMADTPDLPDCNSTMFIDPRGTLWIFWVAIQDNEWGGALLKYRTSTNYQGDGPPVWDWQDVIHTRPLKLAETYEKLLEGAEDKLKPLIAVEPKLVEEIVGIREAAKKKLAARLGWMTRVKPIMTSETRMMLGLYSDVFNCSIVTYTDDWGKTWHCSEPIAPTEPNLLGNVQPALALRKNGDIVAYMRDNGIPKFLRNAVSHDGGITWPEVGMEKNIRDSGSSVDVQVLQSGRWLLVNNALLDGRHRLVAHLSEDEGATWKYIRDIETAEKGKGSFSYPGLIQAKDGTLHITYSYNREGTKGETIKHVAFTEAWLMEGPLTD